MTDDSLNLAPLEMPMRTERLVLREMHPADAEAMSAYNSAELFWRHVPIDPPSLEMTRRFIDRARLARGHAPRLRYQLAIAWPDSDQAIGDIGLTLDSESQRAASLGYGLDPAVWGRGLMTEAVAAMADRAFGHFNVKRLWAVCDPDNRASARVLEKAGFSLEGRLRAHIRLRGVWRDSLLYARLDSDRARDTGSPGSGADIARDMGPGAHALRIRAGIAGGEDRQRGRRRGTSMA